MTDLQKWNLFIYYTRQTAQSYLGSSECVYSVWSRPGFVAYMREDFQTVKLRATAEKMYGASK